MIMGKITYFTGLFLFVLFSLNAQTENDINERVLKSQLADYNIAKPYFEEAYEMYPIPKGIIEAVSYANARFYNVPETEDLSSEGLPQYLGVMGLIFDGKDYFKENGKLIASITNINETELQNQNVRGQILAWAGAFDKLSKEKGISGKKIEDYIPVLITLSEIPWEKAIWQTFAMYSHLYMVLAF